MCKDGGELTSSSSNVCLLYEFVAFSSGWCTRSEFQWVQPDDHAQASPVQTSRSLHLIDLRLSQCKDCVNQEDKLRAVEKEIDDEHWENADVTNGSLWINQNLGLFSINLRVGEKVLKIDMFPASYGESFLVTCTGEQNCYFLIDMGFMSTYSNTIKNKLLEIKNKGESLSLMILTHIDDDHISGAIKFFVENGHSEQPQIIEVENIWFNSYKHLQFEKKTFDEKTQTNKNIVILENLKKKERPREQGFRNVESIGALQGSTLASLLYHYNYLNAWNSHFNSDAVVVEQVDDNFRKIQLTDEVNITILSPDINKLRALNNLWREKLVLEGFEGAVLSSELMDDAFEVYSANTKGMNQRKKNLYKVSTDNDIEQIANEQIDEDCTPVNGSSIAFILEFQEKRVLFLADAHPNILIENLKKIALKEKVEKVYFDAIKVSHHGSKHNTSRELLEIIDADKFIFSTNGRGKGFTHPDIEAVLKIITFNIDRKKTLIFNYKPVHIFQIINKDELKEKYNYEIVYLNDLTVGKDNHITTVII